MAQINLSLTVTPDALAAEVMDAFCEAYGWDVATGLTQRQFIKQWVIEAVLLPYRKKTRATKARQAQIDADAAVGAVSVS